MAKNQKVQLDAPAIDSSIQGATAPLPVEQSQGDTNEVPSDSVPIAAAAQPNTLLARVLAHCHLGEPDDVVEIDAELAPTVSDLVDTNPAAVEYAQSLKA